MKVLIWIGWLFAASAITTALSMSGILLGAIPTVVLYAIVIAGARSCCKKYDEHLEIKLLAQKKIQEKKASDLNNKNEVKTIELESSVVKQGADIPKENTEQKVNDDAVCDYIFCRKCGEKLMADSLFCNRCGVEVIKY